jgi:hypothetical protein
MLMALRAIGRHGGAGHSAFAQDNRLERREDDEQVEAIAMCLM